jgi:hypothetical protein
VDAKKETALAWTDLIFVRMRTSGVSYKQDNEPLVSVK